MPGVDRQLQMNGCRAGVAGDISHRLSEEQEQVPAQVRRKLDVLHFGVRRSDELNAPALGLEHGQGSFPHAADQVGETVASWVDGPDDIAQGGPQTARTRCRIFERFGSALRRLSPGHFAENGDLGQTRSEVVVEIGGQPGANPLHRE